MSQTDTLASFYLALEETPGDSVTLQALADWYEEQDRLDAASCLRWLVRRGRFPFLYRKDAGLVVASTAFTEGWFWWAVDEPIYGRDWGHQTSFWN